MPKKPRTPSPSRTYVMACDVNEFREFEFIKFKLPEEYENTVEAATWFFFNRLDFTHCSSIPAYPYEHHMTMIEK